MAVKPELLAPAGDWECARAAAANGADAIYFGLSKFNARLRATNFTEEDLPRLMDYLHARGMRGYVTFNTLIFTDELAAAEAQLRLLQESRVDAAIVQDLGLARLAHVVAPDVEVHASTQMTLTSPEGLRFAKRLGVERAVLARALATEAAHLLLDEPTANLDLAHQAAILALVRSRCDRRGASAAVVTHDINLAAEFSDFVLLMKQGRSIAFGRPAEVLTPECLGEVFGVRVLVDAHPLTGVPRITPVHEARR